MSLIENRLDHFQEGTFAWFTGVVEDISDPEEMGRVRVRCFGYHTDDRSEIPTKSLPWALVLTPITNPAMDTIGTSATGIMNGSWVVGFFRDGKSAQDPVVLGTLPSLTSNISKSRGFSDPNGINPTRFNSPDMPIEARSQYELSGAYSSRVDSRQINIETAIPPNVSTVDPTSGDANRETWSNYEQTDVQRTKYPFNKVTKTLSGHLIEIDDTEGFERLLTQHRSGTFEEIISDGTKSIVVLGDNYKVIFRNDYVYIKGNCNVTIDGDAKTLIKGNYHLEVEGDYTQNIKGNKRTKVGQNQYEEIDFNYSRNIGRSHNDRVGTDSIIIVDKNASLVVGNDYKETITNDYSSKVTNNRTSDTYGNNEEFVAGNSEIVTSKNHSLRVIGNIDQNSVGTTSLASTDSMTLGTAAEGFLNVGTNLVTKILGENQTFVTGANLLSSGDVNTMIANSHSIIGDVDILGDVNNTGKITSTGVVKAEDCLTFSGKKLNTHKHNVPASGPTSAPI
jgi:hypothetical protein